MRNSLSFKNDKYRKARGGHSRWLRLSCEKCDQVVAIYQKDGPGPLKRLYVDRIAKPERLSKNTPKSLQCKACKTSLGILYTYEKESRLAYRLFAGAVTKKIWKSDNLSEVSKLL